MAEGAYIAIDWGTTNRRVFLMDGDGSVLSTDRDDRGVLAVPDGQFVGEIDAIRARFGALPIIAAGMIGSNRGMAEVPYCAAPADLGSLAAGTLESAADVYIVPGVCVQDAVRPDVMRGEEVQVLGAIAGGMVGPEGLFCQPGTHNKWVLTDAGSIVDFTTSMTGELFALLRGQSVLAGMLDGAVSDGPAFREGLERGAGAGDLPTALFQARAAVLLGTRSREDTASYVSGILIGADVGSQPRAKTDEVVLLSSGALADLYAAAIAWAGGSVRNLDSHAAFVAGIHPIWSMLK